MLTSLRRIAFRGAASVGTWGSHPQRVAGMLLAPTVMVLWHAFLARLGASSAAVACALVTLAAGFDLGARLHRRMSSSVPARLAAVVASVMLAVWIACLPAVLDGVVASVRWFSIESLTSTTGRALFPLGASFAALALPAILIGWLVQSSTSSAQVTASVSPSALWSGVILGGAISVLALFPWVGVHTTASLCAAALAAWRIVAWFERRADNSTATDVATGDARDDFEHSSSVPSQFAYGIACTAAVAVGCSMAAILRVMDQLMLAAAYLGQAEWLAIIAGCLLGMRWSARRPSSDGARPMALLLAGSWAVVVLAAFPALIELSFWMTALVSWPLLLVSARSLFAALMMLPMGVALGMMFSPRTSSDRVAAPLPATLVAAGIAFSQCLLIPDHGPVRAVLAGSSVVAVLMWVVVLRARFTGGWSRAQWQMPAAVAAVVLVAALSPLTSRLYQPAVAARLLFNTNSILARKVGIERGLVLQLDDTRLVTAVDGDRGLVTLWNSRGAQIQLRENGVPHGFASTLPAVNPHPTADLMLATMPLTLHQSPRRVMLLGAGTGLAVRMTQAFPVHEVMCVEPERRLIDILAAHAWPQGDRSPKIDSRMQFVSLETPLALTADPELYDVIISNPRQSSVADAAGEYTREFYRAASARLNEDGLFCQRFSTIDYGPQAFRTVARTLLTAFKEVSIFESSPGELLLFGTNSELGLIREGVVERLQSSHVRQALAEGGWDWAVPLTMVGWDHAALTELAASASPNTAANGRFAFRLPQELMRWSSKLQEIIADVGPKSTRLAAWKVIDGNNPDILTRLAENVGLRNVMATYSDQPQAYRKLLKDQLQKNKTSPIRQIAMLENEDNKQLHPVDQHRAEYLLALGKCVKQRDPDINDVVRLEEYASPYDPLVSYFMHHEAAELHSMRSAPDRAAELEHRLHLSWFSDPRDQSIRPVVRSLELLNEGNIPNVQTATRWDQMNGLLQLLLVRWENRGQKPSGSTQVMLIDVEKSISAIERSFAVMETLAPEMGIADADWQARRTVLERGLVRPLRTYRSQLLPHLMTLERKAKEAAEAMEEATNLE